MSLTWRSSHASWPIRSFWRSYSYWIHVSFRVLHSSWLPSLSMWIMSTTPDHLFSWSCFQAVSGLVLKVCSCSLLEWSRLLQRTIEVCHPSFPRFVLRRHLVYPQLLPIKQWSIICISYKYKLRRTWPTSQRNVARLLVNCAIRNRFVVNMSFGHNMQYRYRKDYKGHIPLCLLGNALGSRESKTWEQIHHGVMALGESHHFQDLRVQTCLVKALINPYRHYYRTTLMTLLVQASDTSKF